MEEKLLDILADICNDDIVKSERQIDLFEAGLLDSIAFTELLVKIEEEFGIEISPSEIDREDINTVNKIIEQVMSRKV